MDGFALRGRRLEVWGRRRSLNVQKVLWLVGGLDDPQFKALNPHGLVPVIQDGATSVLESHAILRYLAATQGAERFWSADPAARALVDGWMDWSQTALQPAFLSGVFWGWRRTPEVLRDPPAVARALERTHRCLARVEERPMANFDPLRTLGEAAIGAAQASAVTIQTAARRLTRDGSPRALSIWRT